ncbi:MAG: hypothetical protein CMF74_07965 [Maricaulis sp.]|jgi:hypothetical protein|nr:hypothetical protein [Maricaulis sp.]HAQ35653.1 hypothetical protein [Alphaproteobacteria bacterium]|tara:strand:- start:311 stop:751 length:441 start_codon:yes stop_codon:yes gene_type:complete
MAAFRLASPSNLQRIITLAIAVVFIVDNLPERLGIASTVSILPGAFYIAAIFYLSALLSYETEGDVFGPKLLRALKWSGGLLLIGAWAQILLVPSLAYLTENGFSEMRGLRFDTSFSNYVIAVLGGSMFFIARRAEQIKARLEEFV